MLMEITACVHDGWLIIDDYKHVSQEFMYYHFLAERQGLVSSSNGSVFNNLKTSDAVNRKHQSRAVAGYAEEVEQLSDADYQTYFDAADAYNRQLNTTPNAFYKPDLVSGYAQTLDISGTGIMGYITIPKISVELPIYHGTDEGVLQVAAGHLEGSSLPVGGAGTHAVISAHRGLPSAKLFTNLDELEVGDRFTITVLNRVLTYEVDQISIVLPTEIDQLLPTEGMDYVTLMTCTPYGINTHRLLVRGKRVETTESQKHIRVAADAFRIEPIIVAPILAIPMLLAALVGVLVAPHLRKRSKRRRK